MGERADRLTSAVTLDRVRAVLLVKERLARRHPGDILRAGLGAGIFIVGALLARTPTVGPFEANLFRLVNQLPEEATLPLWMVMQAGTIGAVGVTTLMAFVARRP